MGIRSNDRSRRRPRARTLFAGSLLLLAALLCHSVVTVAATPMASPSVLPPGDPRSEGEGPGVTWAPLALALGAVVLIGLVAAGGTLLVLRLTADDRL